MKFTFNYLINPVLLVFVLLPVFGLSLQDSHAEEASLSETTFYVY